MIGTLQLLRTDPHHIGSSPLIGEQSVQSNTKLQTEKKSNSFENYLIDAVQYVNNKQSVSDSMAEKLLTDPDSVDVHDVTIAMAEASLSLNIAQNVIDRIVKGWSEITTTR